MNIKIFTVLILALTTMPGFANQATNADEKFVSSCKSAAKNVAKFKANKGSLYSRRNPTYRPTSLEMEQKMADDSNVFSNMASKYNAEVNKCVEEYRQKKYAKGETIKYEESTCNCNPDNAKPAPTKEIGDKIYDILKCDCSGAWTSFQDSCKDQPINSIQTAYENELIKKHCDLTAHKKAEKEQLNQTSEQINNTVSSEQKAATSGFKNQIMTIKDAFHKRVEELIKECENKKGTISENGECVEPEQKGEKQ